MIFRWALVGLVACGDPETECEVADQLAAWTDADGDGAGDPGSPVTVCELATDQVLNDDDCDDATADIGPGSDELCDGIDQDCNGEIDDGLVLDSWYADVDGDGYGDGDGEVTGCAQPPDTVGNQSDCDDTDSEISPDAVEVCDSVDNDCDSAVDSDDPDVDTSSGTTFYRDLDRDGFGDDGSTTRACESPDPTRFIEIGGDCDDLDEDRFPGQDEVCDRTDNNCDGLVDEDDPLLDLSTLETLYVDGDQDGLGDDTQTLEACFPSAGETPFGGDCDDSNPQVGLPFDWLLDGDEDGVGAGAVIGTACTIPVAGAVIDAGREDCDDADPAISPVALEVCDTIDNDCDNQIDDADPSVDLTDGITLFADRDHDGFGGTDQIRACANPNPMNFTLIEGDCDDRDPQSFPENPEVCDGADNDCDTLVDLADPTLDPSTLLPLFEDLDEDGFGVTPILACGPGPGIAEVDGDCDDDDPALQGPALWQVDGDGDGVGAGAVLGVETCLAPQPGAVPQIDTDDCADANPAIFPGADDICADGIDQDCDGIDAPCGPVGSFEVADGPPWSNNPPVFSCLDACAFIFGGVATDYECSTSDVVVDNQGYVTGWGDPQYCTTPVAETFSLDQMGGGYDCGFVGCSYSALAADHCSVGMSRNFCW